MSGVTTNPKALDIFNKGETNRSTVHAGRLGDLFWFSDADQKTIRATLAQQSAIEPTHGDTGEKLLEPIISLLQYPGIKEYVGALTYNPALEAVKNIRATLNTRHPTGDQWLQEINSIDARKWRALMQSRMYCMGWAGFNEDQAKPDDGYRHISLNLWTVGEIDKSSHDLGYGWQQDVDGLKMLNDFIEVALKNPNHRSRLITPPTNGGDE